MVTAAPAPTLLIRVAVGWVFLTEGVQKFLYSATRGAGRFELIGIPWPEFVGPFVGTIEVTCGALLLVGLFTRLSAIPLLITMVVAIFSTKLPILLGHGFWGFALKDLSSYGFWSMMHESRTDFAMLLGATFLVVAGAGRLSLDYYYTRAS
jgi:uncharacterized membrane protein YphA (DoxX/SURF4 family)